MAGGAVSQPVLVALATSFVSVMGQHGSHIYLPMTIMSRTRPLAGPDSQLMGQQMIWRLVSSLQTYPCKINAGKHIHAGQMLTNIIHTRQMLTNISINADKLIHARQIIMANISMNDKCWQTYPRKTNAANIALQDKYWQT